MPVKEKERRNNALCQKCNSIPKELRINFSTVQFRLPLPPGPAIPMSLGPRAVEIFLERKLTNRTLRIQYIFDGLPTECRS